MDTLLTKIKKFIPKKLFKKLQPAYHFFLAFIAALLYRFPSKDINVIFITGTKGKTSTAEMVSAVLEGAGFKTALVGTLRFKVGNTSTPNLYKMTMPGRFFVQKFLRKAVNAKCDYAVMEMTSQAAVQYRHKFIDMDTLIFLNLTPDHIESHGSYERYVLAKLSLGQALQKSRKPRKILVANADDKESSRFLDLDNLEKHTFSVSRLESHVLNESGVKFVYKGVRVNSPLPGIFTISNMLAALTFAETQNISLDVAACALSKIEEIKGRVQKITLPKHHPLSAEQHFTVVVDYAHTPDSLEKLYGAFDTSKKICVLGNTGGGRDTWKRPEMAKIADKHCSYIILTDEDPYDENPEKIVNEMAAGITTNQFDIIMDRRLAIKTALERARKLKQISGDEQISVLISGKGTDPYIMRANGKKEPWSDANVAREELESVLRK